MVISLSVKTSKPLRDRPDRAAVRYGGRFVDLENNRAELVLLLGILSLFLCGPVGVAAWIMGSSDLRKIREGIMIPRRVVYLRIGLLLGVLGTILFCVCVVVVALLFAHGIINLSPLNKRGPLPPDKIVFAGEWFGARGTFIRISVDGRGDYKARHASVTGGQVSIKEESLSITIIGLSKTWHIDRRPCLVNGSWKMKLEGEEFVRKAEELLVYLMTPTIHDHRTRFIHEGSFTGFIVSGNNFSTEPGNRDLPGTRSTC